MTTTVDKFEDSVRKAGEWAFFEQVYQCRKFLYDEDALKFNLPDDVRDFFWLGEEYGKYTYINATDEFLNLIFNTSLGFKLTDFLPPTGIEQLDNLAESLSNVGKEHNKQKIIEMQNSFILQRLKDGNALQVSQDYFLDKYQPIPNDKKLIKTFHRFFLVSCKYGIYIPDLIYQLDISSALLYFYDNIATNRDKASLCPSTIGHPRYVDFFPPSMNPEKDKFFRHSTRAKSILNIDLSSLDKSSRTHQSFIKSIKDLFPGKFRLQSSHLRLAGLWLWDAIDNPRCENKMSFSAAFKKFILSFPIFEKICPNHQYQYLYNAYHITKECIRTGEVIPLTDQNVKRIIKGGQPKPAAS